MQTPVFTVETTMEKNDYRKFLYTATFLKTWYLLPMLLGMTLLGALLLAWVKESFAVPAILPLWVELSVVAVGAVCFQVEHKNKRRQKTDRSGTFGSKTILRFYEDKLEMETVSPASKGELAYEQFYQLLESRTFFIFYINATQASLLRKVDVSDVKELRTFLKAKFENRYHTVFGVKA